MDTSTSTPASADPFDQAVTLLDPTGQPFDITLADLDAFITYGARICINYASQTGACFTLFAVLFLVTRPEKRRSPIFALNASGLLLDGIRNILQCIYFTGPFYHVYAQFTSDFSRVPASQFGASVAGIVLTFLLVVCVEASLVFQVRAVCVTLRRAHKVMLVVASLAVALTAIGFRFALMVINSLAVVHLDDFIDYYWLVSACNYVVMGSICFFTAIFVTKLGFALRQRRNMGIRSFGPMQVIFIMGCQTLIIPAIFSILQNFTSVPELGSQTLTLVVLFLPLSSLWASASLETATRKASHNGQPVGLFHRRASPNLAPRTNNTVSSVATTHDSIDEKCESKRDKFGFFGRWKRGSTDRAMLVGDDAEKGFGSDVGSGFGASSQTQATGGRRGTDQSLVADGVQVERWVGVSEERVR